MASLVQSTPFDLPGFTLPLNFKPEAQNGYTSVLFPNALDSSDIVAGRVGYIFTIRELLMLRIMETITDKPDWDKKVFNEEITAKWREEIKNSSIGGDVTPAMIDYLLKELQWRTTEFSSTGIITSYDPGVVKSDTAIPADLQQALRDAVKPLEDVPEDQKDYHPRSDQKVVDLVHPSLFPVIYGRTRVLRDRLIGVDDCFTSVGQGEVTKVPGTETARLSPDDIVPRFQQDNAQTLQPYSRNYQWLPCDVQLTADGECRIASYINNLHPVKHRALYTVIEKILTRTIPLWNITLTDKPNIPSRIEYQDVEYPSDEDPEPDFEANQDHETYNRVWAEWHENRHVVLPEPNEFEPPKPGKLIDLKSRFGDKGLQVIVKLANIELTPEKPEYEGGSWHIEGQLNERICATAIYYYDSENITDNTLSFRHRANTDYAQEIGYEQNHHLFLKEVFGFDMAVSEFDDGSITQDLGSVQCREGRLLTFPNTLQHRVSPFSLVDRSKPGHRKILALFLVDPNIRIISSANVPPQREDWCEELQQVIGNVLGNRLPAELQDMVHKDLDFTPITMDEAKEYRLKLMDERSAKSTRQNEEFETGSFSLCEH